MDIKKVVKILNFNKAKKENVNIKNEKNVFQILRTSLLLRTESFFYWHGKNVSQRPYSTIVVCLLLTLISSLGFLNYSLELTPYKLWIPKNSELIDTIFWKAKHFPSKYGKEMVLYEADNVLDKNIILAMLDAHDLVWNVSTPDATWKSSCLKLPVYPQSYFSKKRKRSVNNKIDRGKRNLEWWASFLSKEDTCKLISVLEEECLEYSLLDIWGYDRGIVESLTTEDIIHDVNEAQLSKKFGTRRNYMKLLGKIQRNKDGLIIGAKSTLQIWISEVNLSTPASNKVLNPWAAEETNKELLGWRHQFIKTLLNYSSTKNDFKMHVYSYSSFDSVMESSIQSDIILYLLGFLTVFIFCLVMLSKFNHIEQRPWLAAGGIACVMLSIINSFGLCLFFNVMFSRINFVMPFLLLGLGVDDMFVIVQSFNTLKKEDTKKSLEERVAITLKHAGVSITITSLTDFVAFLIGSTSSIPLLKSFCIYAAVGVIVVYILQATLFVAFLTLDQIRLEDCRNGFMCCIHYPKKCTVNTDAKQISHSILENFIALILKQSIKLVVITLTIALVTVSLWATCNLRQEFKAIWLLPENSYIKNFWNAIIINFSSNINGGKIMFGNISISEFSKLSNITAELQNNRFIVRTESWYDDFEIYIRDTYSSTVDIYKNETAFFEKLSEFLYTPAGSIHRISNNILFKGSISCNKPLPNISAFSIDYYFKYITDPNDKITLMDDLKNIAKHSDFSGFVKPFSIYHYDFETERVINKEFARNIVFASILIGIMMMILVASVPMSLILVANVFAIIVETGGLMYFLGITINIISCVLTVLGIGFSVDYVSHIGHTFMTEEGTRDERVRKTILKIGPAVLNGCLSNMLAFLFLAFTDTYIFKTFFKIMFSVSVFGLFHAMFALPVILSLIGPPPYERSKSELNENCSEDSEEMKELVISPKPSVDSNETH